MNWRVLMEKLNAKSTNGTNNTDETSNTESLSLIKEKLPVDGGHTYDEMINAATSSWIGTPAEDPFGLSSPSYQRVECCMEEEEDPEADTKIFDYFDWYWKYHGKRQLVVKPIGTPSNYSRDAFFANVHATLASNCTPRMYDGLRDPKTYPLESPREYSKTVQVQNYQQTLHASPRSRLEHMRHVRDPIYDGNMPPSFANYMERRLHSPSRGLNEQHKTENWFRQHKFMEKAHLDSPNRFIDFEVPYTPESDKCYLSPINEELHNKHRYRHYHESPPATTSKSDSNLMTPKRRTYRQKESAY